MTPLIVHDVLENYSRLKKNSWPQLELVAVKCTLTASLTPDDAHERVAQAAQSKEFQGWVRFRSALWSSRDGLHSHPARDASGPPLAAEWCAMDESSVRLGSDPDAPGKFRILEYTERKLTGAEALAEEERAALRQELTVLAHPIPGKAPYDSVCDVLVYHVFLGGTKADPSGSRRLFDRFVKFDRRKAIVETWKR